MDSIERLHWAVQSRVTPEAVCGIIIQTLGARLLPAQRRLLHRAAASGAGQYSSMGDDFERPVPLTHKVTVLAELLSQHGVDDEAVLVGRDDIPAEKLEELAQDPWKLLGELRHIAPFVGWHPGSDFGARLNRDRREMGGIRLSRRRYNRLIRHLLRTQAQAKRMGPQILLHQLVRVSRSGLATYITVDEMRADPFAAAFVAYWTAQRNRRRAATTAGRDNPFDVIAEMLLQVCARRADTDWWMIARAYPQPGVVASLDDFHRGHLVGQWLSFMRVAAGILRGLYEAWPDVDVPPVMPDSMWAGRPGLMPSRQARGGKTVKAVDLATMAVVPGIDSSTWNTAAAAYNAARGAWLNCIAASGALGLLDAACPGKAMRVIAGDVAAWHRNEGSGGESQTRVWADLPLPWRVIAGDEQCPAELVEARCWEHGVDPQASGWTAPRQHAGVVSGWAPTPELVHGVEVADPLWAGLLRRSGLWSGGPVSDQATDLYAAYRSSTAVGNTTVGNAT
jgi:hypothetical protein